ncbi:MAG: hypothetical protein M3Y17_08755, partial [Actinomycetota bacterium]|nr:hypothetical protein [Actinomycetota bacterium]
IGALSCPGQVLCVAVAHGGTIIYGEPFHQRVWDVVPGIGEISGISCLSTRACIAVGSGGTVTAGRALP